MIPLSAINLPNSDWQSQLKTGFKDANELLRYLNLPTTLGCEDSAKDFAVRVPLAFAQRMQKANRLDPLLLQVLPLAAEQQAADGFVNDPVGDLHAIEQKGLIHKYHGRALLMLTGSCAVNCRYCFRRNFPYDEQALSKADRQQVIDHLQRQPDIREIIFSGGDPLMLSDALLEQWLTALAPIQHIQRIRVHSRLPIVLPDRITQRLLNAFSATDKQLCFVVHSNHPQELDHQVAAAVSRLKSVGFSVLNQSVLLKGINDSAEVLITLSEELFAKGILPYYIHLLDKAAGTQHFAIPKAQALLLHQQLQHTLPGYLVPKLVQEIAGEPSKTPVLG